MLTKLRPTPPPIPEVKAEVQPVALVRADRCDNLKCSAQARVRVTMHAGFLDFCRHHFNAYEEAIFLLQSVAHIEDNRDRIE